MDGYSPEWEEFNQKMIFSAQIMTLISVPFIGVPPQGWELQVLVV